MAGNGPGLGDRADRDHVDRDRMQCSFCGKRYFDVAAMVCGPTPAVAICNECIDLVTEIMAEQDDGAPPAA